jgi:hypothetical protein
VRAHAHELADPGEVEYQQPEAEAELAALPVTEPPHQRQSEQVAERAGCLQQYPAILARITVKSKLCGDSSLANCIAFELLMVQKSSILHACSSVTLPSVPSHWKTGFI